MQIQCFPFHLWKCADKQCEQPVTSPRMLGALQEGCAHPPAAGRLTRGREIQCTCGKRGKAGALRNRATVHLKFQSSCKTQPHEEGMNGAVFISAMQMSVSTAMLSLVIRKQRDFIRRPPSLIMENVYTG